MKEEKKVGHEEECECDKPEIRDSFKGGCSKAQIIKCHGKSYFDKLKHDT